MTPKDSNTFYRVLPWNSSSEVIDFKTFVSVLVKYVPRHFNQPFLNKQIKLFLDLIETRMTKFKKCLITHALFSLLLANKHMLALYPKFTRSIRDKLIYFKQNEGLMGSSLYNMHQEWVFDDWFDSIDLDTKLDANGKSIYTTTQEDMNIVLEKNRNVLTKLIEIDKSNISEVDFNEISAYIK